MKPVILVIDDQKDERKLVRLLLRQYDCELVEATNAKDGLEAARKRAPRVIMTDHTMPGMSGYDAVFELRQDPALRNTPVIMLTSRKFVPGFKEFMGMQGVSFLPKPVQAGTLVATLTSLMGPLAKARPAGVAAAPAAPVASAAPAAPAPAAG